MTLGAEDRIHRWLRRKMRQSGFDRIGDDGAILPAGGPWAATLDHQIEGIHFPTGLDPSLIARRLLAVNLSDLAAMGAQPEFAFLALSCPPEFDIRRLLSSFIAACATHEAELAGGDLARNDKVTASVTLLGKRPAGGRWLKRSHCRPGDSLWVAGDLGLSAVGRHLLDRGARIEGRRVHLPPALVLTSREETLARRSVWRHLIPRPQLRVGRWLATRRRAAAIDVSDGLAIDLHRLCRESTVGARIVEERLPIRGNFGRLCGKLGIRPLDTILAGGEDYALLFSIPPRTRPPASLACQKIGRVHAAPEISWSSPDQTASIPASGWDHFSSTTEAS